MQIGEMHHGPRNLITDVPGVTVGHCTVDREDNHTGVTVVMPCPENPYTHKLTAASFVLNGFGRLRDCCRLMNWVRWRHRLL
jgi:D-aminopeptidase